MENKETHIKEISAKETKKFSRCLIDFNPIKCVACGNKKNIVQRFFLLDVLVENESIHRKVKKALRNKYGLSYYGYNEKNKKVITTAKCPECDGEKMDWDY